MTTTELTHQQQQIVELQHVRARSVGRKRKADYHAYEAIKNVLRSYNLQPDDYEREMQQVARELGV